MELQNSQVIGVREQEHFDKTNNNTLVGASGNPMAFFIFFSCLFSSVGSEFQGLIKGSTTYLASGNGRSMQNIPFRGPEHPLRCW